MTIECYDITCPYHEFNKIDGDDGPYCHESVCKCPNDDDINYDPALDPCNHPENIR